MFTLTLQYEVTSSHAIPRLAWWARGNWFNRIVAIILVFTSLLWLLTPSSSPAWIRPLIVKLGGGSLDISFGNQTGQLRLEDVPVHYPCVLEGRSAGILAASWSAADIGAAVQWLRAFMATVHETGEPPCEPRECIRHPNA